MSTINGVFYLLSFSLVGLLFSQNGLSYGSEILYGVFIHQKIRLGVGEKLGDPFSAQGGDFLTFILNNKKCLESP